MIPSLETSPLQQTGGQALHVAGLSGGRFNSNAAASVDRDNTPVIRRNDVARPGRPFSYLDQSSQTQAQAVQNNKISATSITATSRVYPNAESSDGLTESEKRKVRELQARDRQVREHEQAHKVAGGQFASSPTYRTVVGPDGRSYAVGGEVRIDTSTVPNNPEATIRKLQIVKRAALAPREPSSADRAVAAEAEQKILRARAEIQKQKNLDAQKAREKGDAFIKKSSSLAMVTKPDGEPLFNPEKRFLGEKLGLGKVDTQVIKNATMLTPGDGGVLDPGELLSLIA